MSETTLPDVPSDADLGAATEAPAPEAEAPAEAAQEAPAEAVEAAEAAEAAQPADRPMVPLPALREAREEARRARDELKAMESKLSTLQQMILQRVIPKEEAPQPPDLEADPVGHLRTISGELQALKAQRQQEQEQAQIVSVYRHSATQFAQQAPDFQDAHDHVVRHLSAVAPIVGRHPLDLERDIVVSALQQGRNPAEAIYEFARAAGYAKQAAPAVPQPSPVAPVRAGQAASRSVGTGGTPASGSGNLTAERLASMSFADFRKLSDADLERALGG